MVIDGLLRHNYVPQFLDVRIRTLAHNPWPENIHLAVGLKSGDVRVYSDLLSSIHKLFWQLCQAVVMACCNIATRPTCPQFTALVACQCCYNISIFGHTNNVLGISRGRLQDFALSSAISNVSFVSDNSLCWIVSWLMPQTSRSRSISMPERSSLEVTFLHLLP